MNSSLGNTSFLNPNSSSLDNGWCSVSTGWVGGGGGMVEEDREEEEGVDRERKTVDQEIRWPEAGVLYRKSEAVIGLLDVSKAESIHF